MVKTPKSSFHKKVKLNIFARLVPTFLVLIFFSLSCSLLQSQEPSAEDYFNQGNQYYGQGQYAQAIDSYTKAIQLDPQVASAYGNRGLVYSDQKQYDLAVADLNKAIEARPDTRASLQQSRDCLQ